MASEKKLYTSGPDRIKFHVPADLKAKPYIEYYDEEGKRVRLYGGLTEPKTYEGRVLAAQRKMAEIIAEYIPQKPLDTRAWEWLESRKPQWRPKSYYSYCSKLRKFISWKDGRKMSHELVSEFFRYLEGRVSNGTRNDYKRYLNHIFTSVCSNDYFGHIKQVRHHAQTKKHYQRHQIATITDYLAEEDPELLFMCQCVYYLLARPNSELRLLQVMHFELDDWRVFIPAHISKNNRDGYVLIPEAFRDDVLNYLKGKRPKDYIFPSSQKPGKPVGYNTLLTRYRKHLNKLGFGNEYSLYGWKNTGNMALVRAGVHVKFIQNQNRHSTLEMTDRYLSRIGCDFVGDLAEKFPSM